MQSTDQIEPGMGVENAQRSPAVTDLPGDAPRGPLASYAGAVRKDYRHLGVQLTADLYGSIVAAAKAEGAGTSAYVRRILADHLGEAAPLDRVDGGKVPPAELAAASVLLGHLTQLVIASRDLGDGQAGNAIAMMETAHGRLVRIIERLEG